MGTRAVRRLTATALLSLLCLGWLVGGADPAVAHTTLVEVRPADGAVLSQPVRQLELIFDRRVHGPVSLLVAGPDGALVGAGSAELSGRSVRQVLRPAAAPGRYQVSFRVIGDDGHPVVGQTGFSLGAAVGVSPGADRGAALGAAASWFGLVLLLAGLAILGRGRPRQQWLGAALLTLGVLVGALAIGGGAPRPAPAGLPDPGPLTGWSLPIIRLVTQAGLIAAFGWVLLATALLPDNAQPARQRAFRLAGIGAAVAAMAGVGQAILARSEVLAVSAVSAAAPRGLSGYLVTDRQGRAMLAQVLLSCGVALLARRSLRGPTGWVALLAAALALLPAVLAGHSVAVGAPGLSGTVISVHVLAVAAWVGGLLALGWAVRVQVDGVQVAIRRYSPLATGCLLLVAVTGLGSATIRVGGLDGLLTGYGALLLAKLLLFVVIAEVGRRQRVSVRGGSGLFRLVLPELTLMATAIAIGVALTRTPLPKRRFVPPVDGGDLLGYSPPRQATVPRLLTGVLLDGPALAAIGVLAVGYLLAVLALRRRGRCWPVGASLAWAAGLLLLAWATVGGLGVYARVSLPAQVAAHLLIATAVPILLLRGAPGALVSTLAPDRTAGAGRARAWRVLSAPEVALTWFALAVFGWYLPAVFSAVMLRPGGYWLITVTGFSAGLLLFARVVPPAGPGSVVVERFHGRVLLLGGALGMIAAASLALTWSRLLVGEAYYRQLTVPYFRVLPDEQRLAGTWIWVAGGVPVLLLAAALILARESDRPGPAQDSGSDRELTQTG